MFQSAPLTEARGDTHSLDYPTPTQCFNPLPSPKQGETDRLRLEGAVDGGFQSAPLTEARGDGSSSSRRCCGRWVSIRSPHRSKGRPLTDNVLEADNVVSIRSPHRSKGRPLPSARPHGQNEVSIRSPHRSKGRPTRKPLRGLGLWVSIRSPHRSKGRRQGGVVGDGGPQRFNPLPSPKQGETQGF